LAQQGIPKVPGRRLSCELRVQFYLFLAKVSAPLIGTHLVLTPEMNGLRFIPNFIFFLLCPYFGYLRPPKPKGIVLESEDEEASVSRPAGDVQLHGAYVRQLRSEFGRIRDSDLLFVSRSPRLSNT
jgi:hypothetical protein